MMLTDTSIVEESQEYSPIQSYSLRVSRSLTTMASSRFQLQKEPLSSFLQDIQGICSLDCGTTVCKILKLK